MEAEGRDEFDESDGEENPLEINAPVDDLDDDFLLRDDDEDDTNGNGTSLDFDNETYLNDDDAGFTFSEGMGRSADLIEQDESGTALLDYEDEGYLDDPIDDDVGFNDLIHQRSATSATNASEAIVAGLNPFLITKRDETLSEVIAKSWSSERQIQQDRFQTSNQMFANRVPRCGLMRDDDDQNENGTASLDFADDVYLNDDDGFSFSGEVYRSNGIKHQPNSPTNITNYRRKTEASVNPFLRTKSVNLATKVKITDASVAKAAGLNPFLFTKKDEALSDVIAKSWSSRRQIEQCHFEENQNFANGVPEIGLLRDDEDDYNEIETTSFDYEDNMHLDDGQAGSQFLPQMDRSGDLIHQRNLATNINSREDEEAGLNPFLATRNVNLATKVTNAREAKVAGLNPFLLTKKDEALSDVIARSRPSKRKIEQDNFEEEQNFASAVLGTARFGLPRNFGHIGSQFCLFDFPSIDHGFLSADQIIRAQTRPVTTLADAADVENSRPRKKNKNFPALFHFKPEIKKYYHQRYKLFSKFDKGIQLDEESWYSVTPEMIAKHTAQRCKTPGVIIDAFCGCGGNTIQFAKTCGKVIAIDIDPKKIEMAKNNAAIYGVLDKITFMCADFMDVAPNLKADVVFLSPPWGGVDYLGASVFDLKTMIPMDGYKIYALARSISTDIAYFVPRNVNEKQLGELAGVGHNVQIEKNMLNGKTKAITAYYGDLIRPPTC